MYQIGIKSVSILIFFLLFFFLGLNKAYAVGPACDKCKQDNPNNVASCYAVGAACEDRSRAGCNDCLITNNGDTNICFGYNQNCGDPLACQFTAVGLVPITLQEIVKGDNDIKRQIATEIGKVIEIPTASGLRNCADTRQGAYNFLSCNPDPQNNTALPLLCGGQVTRLDDSILERKTILKPVSEVAGQLKIDKTAVAEVEKVLCPSPKKLNAVFVVSGEEKQIMLDVQCCESSDPNSCKSIDITAKDDNGIPVAAKQAAAAACEASCRGNELAKDPKYKCRAGVPQCCIGSQPVCLDYESAINLIQNFQSYDNKKPFAQQSPEWFRSTSKNILNLSAALCGDKSSDPRYQVVQRNGYIAATLGYAIPMPLVGNINLGALAEATTNAWLAILNCTLEPEV